MNEVTPDLERWLPVPSFEDLYEISNLGRVNSLPRWKTRGGILKGMPDSAGYLQVGLWCQGVSKRIRIHQLVMLAFVGPPEEGQEVRHLDGDPANNRWAPGETDDEIRANGGNLTYGSHAENVADILQHGRNHQANRTHCPQGHEYTEENTRWYQGQRYCRRCGMLYTWKKRGKEPDSPRRRPRRQTHCRNGHEYTPENTYIQPTTGRRSCVLCMERRRSRTQTGHPRRPMAA